MINKSKTVKTEQDLTCCSLLCCQHLGIRKLKDVLVKYSGCHWKVYACCFMKQNCHFQINVLQFRNAIEILRHSYHTLALSKEVHNLISAQGAQKLPALKVWMFIFPWYDTFYISIVADNFRAPWAKTKSYTSFESANVWYEWPRSSMA